MKGTCSWCNGVPAGTVHINSAEPEPGCTACGGTGEVELKDPTDKDIGARIKDAREHAGLSLKQAAKVLDFHMTDLILIEEGQRPCTAIELVKFVDAYAVSPEWIIGMIHDTDIPKEWIEMIEKLPSKTDRRKLMHIIAMADIG